MKRILSNAIGFKKKNHVSGERFMLSLLFNRNNCSHCLQEECSGRLVMATNVDPD